MTALRIHALDGARLTMRRDELLDGESPEPTTIVCPTFLVEHDAGLVLVDTGLDPDAVGDPVGAFGEVGRQIRYEPAQRVDAQLETLGVATTDVTHVVLTHVHFDHAGGLKLFGHADLYVGRGDEPSVRGEDTTIAREADLAPVRDAAWHLVDGDLDLFGDGGVVILALPGHTPGNTGVLVRLPDRTVLLVGDTAHLRGALTDPRPMGADSDPEQAVASLHRVNELAARYDAEVWVSHDL